MAGGLWGVAVLLVLAAVIARALGRGSRRRPLLVVAGAGIGLLLLLAIQLLLLAGSYDPSGAISSDQRY